MKKEKKILMDLLFAIIEIILGLGAILLPEKIAMLPNGWRYNYDEPSEKYVNLIKFFGYVSFLTGLAEVIR